VRGLEKGGGEDFSERLLEMESGKNWTVENHLNPNKLEKPHMGPYTKKTKNNNKAFLEKEGRKGKRQAATTQPQRDKKASHSTGGMHSGNKLGNHLKKKRATPATMKREPYWKSESCSRGLDERGRGLAKGGRRNPTTSWSNSAD